MLEMLEAAAEKGKSGQRARAAHIRQRGTTTTTTLAVTAATAGIMSVQVAKCTFLSTYCRNRALDHSQADTKQASSADKLQALPQVG